MGVSDVNPIRNPITINGVWIFTIPVDLQPAQAVTEATGARLAGFRWIFGGGLADFFDVHMRGGF
jgi:hypothetical protein